MKEVVIENEGKKIIKSQVERERERLMLYTFRFYLCTEVKTFTERKFTLTFKFAPCCQDELWREEIAVSFASVAEEMEGVGKWGGRGCDLTDQQIQRR